MGLGWFRICSGDQAWVLLLRDKVQEGAAPKGLSPLSFGSEVGTFMCSPRPVKHLDPVAEEALEIGKGLGAGETPHD